MSLSWKDGVATVLTVAVGLIAYVRLKSLEWPLLSSWRMGTLAVFVLGIGTCIVVGSGIVPTKNSWTTAATVLGILAFLLTAVGLITGNKFAFVALVTDIAALWLLSTMHHVLTVK